LAIRIAKNASVSDAAKLSDNSSVWDFAQVRENAVVGENSIIGSYSYIDANVQIGANCKIQNRALICDPAVIHDGVFIGPGAILTNDKNPRSTSVLGEIKQASGWEKTGVEVFLVHQLELERFVLHLSRLGNGLPLVLGQWLLKVLKTMQ
jgi:UDP-2-acetamido-3-amino-2,3-dideoxy-glucuronate N-acetyltransferase